MESKHFYFIKDSYFEDIHDSALMQNKEDGRGRPCFFAIQDKDGLFWMIPISSKVEKYHQILESKIKKNGKCDTIFFANVLGQERAFLIQNMFPIIEEYVADEYIQMPNKNPVMISETSSKELLEKFKTVLALVNHGKINIVFPDILKIRGWLLETKKTYADVKEVANTPTDELVKKAPWK